VTSAVDRLWTRLERLPLARRAKRTVAQIRAVAVEVGALIDAVWRRSLQVRVVVSTLALSAAVILVLGLVLQTQIAGRILQGKEVDALGQAECLACHSNHRIESPSDSFIGLGKGAVCAECHDETGESAATIRTMRGDLDRLSAGLSSADAVLTRAERAGMLVDEGRAALRDAREHQVQTRVLVHSFAAQPFGEAARLGIGSASRAQEDGEAAMRELQVRRRGLAVATLAILAFLVTLWLKIRRLPLGPQDSTRA